MVYLSLHCFFCSFHSSHFSRRYPAQNGMQTGRNEFLFMIILAEKEQTVHKILFHFLKVTITAPNMKTPVSLNLCRTLEWAIEGQSVRSNVGHSTFPADDHLSALKYHTVYEVGKTSDIFQITLGKPGPLPQVITCPFCMIFWISRIFAPNGKI